MRVDSDDYLSMDAVSVFSLFLDHNPSIGFVYGDLVCLGEAGNVKRRISLENGDDYMDYGAGMLFRRQLLLNAGGYDKELRNAEDFELFMRLRAANVKGLHVPLELYRYYSGSDNLTNGSQREGIKKEIQRKLKNV